VGSVATTSDGGRTWRYVRTGPHGQLLNGVSFIDSHTGWAVGEQMHADMAPSYKTALVLHTGDGGATWAPQSLGDQWDDADLMLLDVVFTDARKGWAVGALNDDPKADPLAGHGVAFRTTDGGATWVEGTTGQLPGSWLVTVAFEDEQHGWAGGDGALLYTSDAGKAWTKQAAGDLEVWAIACRGGTVAAAGLAPDQAGQKVPALWRYAAP